MGDSQRYFLKYTLEHSSIVETAPHLEWFSIGFGASASCICILQRTSGRFGVFMGDELSIFNRHVRRHYSQQSKRDHIIV